MKHRLFLVSMHLFLFFLWVTLPRFAEAADDVQKFVGHTGPVPTVTLLPGGKQMVSGGFDKTIRIWDLATGKNTKTHEGFIGRINALALNPVSLKKGAKQITGAVGTDVETDRIQIWDWTKQAKLSQVTDFGHDVRCLSFSSDGKFMAASTGNKQINVWTVSTGAKVRMLEGKIVAQSVALSNTGAIGVYTSDDNLLQSFDVKSGKLLEKFKGHTAEVLSVQFSADGKQIYSASVDGTIRIWDAKSAKEVGILKGHTGPIGCLAVSPDGSRILSGGLDKTVKLWDAKTYKELDSFTDHKERVMGIAFGEEGKSYVSSSSDGSIAVRKLP